MSDSSVNSPQILFPPLWGPSPSLLQDAAIAVCRPFLRAAGIQQNTISLLWDFVLLLLYCHFGKKWAYGPPAETQQELLFLLSSCGQCGTSRLQSLPPSRSGKIQPNSSRRACGCTPASPPTPSAPASNARWIQRCSFSISPLSFSTLIFNPVSTDRCRQM